MYSNGRRNYYQEGYPSERISPGKKKGGLSHRWWLIIGIAVVVVIVVAIILYFAFRSTPPPQASSQVARETTPSENIRDPEGNLINGDRFRGDAPPNGAGFRGAPPTAQRVIDRNVVCPDLDGDLPVPEFNKPFLIRGFDASSDLGSDFKTDYLMVSSPGTGEPNLSVANLDVNLPNQTFSYKWQYTPEKFIRGTSINHITKGTEEYIFCKTRNGESTVYLSGTRGFNCTSGTTELDFEYTTSGVDKGRWCHTDDATGQLACIQAFPVRNPTNLSGADGAIGPLNLSNGSKWVNEMLI